LLNSQREKQLNSIVQRDFIGQGQNAFLMNCSTMPLIVGIAPAAIPATHFGTNVRKMLLAALVTLMAVDRPLRLEREPT